MKKFFCSLMCLIALGGLSDIGAQSKNKSDSSKPKYSAPSSKPAPTPPRPQPTQVASPKKSEPFKTEKPKYAAPTPTPAPTKTSPPVVTNSFKPSSTGVSEKARSAKEASSERKFIETQKAVAPPKQRYTTPDGKDVPVRTATHDAEVIRNMPSTKIQPEVRQQTATVHVTQHNYTHDYNWYRSQPVVYVGGGYSSAFWYMMAEWDAERRARWLYNHRYSIENDAYERGLRDAQVAAAINRLESQRAYRDPNYIDPEFRSDPAMAYTDDYVEAVYNPPVHREPTEPYDSGAAVAVFQWIGAILLMGVICWGLYALCFKVRWGK